MKECKWKSLRALLNGLAGASLVFLGGLSLESQANPPSVEPLKVESAAQDPVNWRYVQDLAYQLQNRVQRARYWAEQEAGRPGGGGWRQIGVRDLRYLEQRVDYFLFQLRSFNREVAIIDAYLADVERALWDAERTVTRREFTYRVVSQVEDARRLVDAIDRELGFAR